METSEIGNDYATRFSGIARLYGIAGLARLRAAHVCVIGIGGVGSWTVEALARSGVGQLTLVDLDDVCVSNVNRQLHALSETVGQSKIEVIAERVKAINPECEVHCEHAFFTENSAPRLLEQPFDYVVDAIDSSKNKCLLIATCRKRKIPVITIGGAGGLLDPSQVAINDLSKSYNDPLLFQVRKELRQKYNFPRERRWKFKVACVYSPEAAVFPEPEGDACDTSKAKTGLRLDCENGLGSATFLTGTFGFTAASHVVKELAAGE